VREVLDPEPPPLAGSSTQEIEVPGPSERRSFSCAEDNAGASGRPGVPISSVART
jgi:hypothetical protein